MGVYGSPEISQEAIHYETCKCRRCGAQIFKGRRVCPICGVTLKKSNAIRNICVLIALVGVINYKYDTLSRIMEYTETFYSSNNEETFYADTNLNGANADRIQSITISTTDNYGNILESITTSSVTELKEIIAKNLVDTENRITDGLYTMLDCPRIVDNVQLDNIIENMSYETGTVNSLIGRLLEYRSKLDSYKTLNELESVYNDICNINREIQELYTDIYKQSLIYTVVYNDLITNKQGSTQCSEKANELIQRINKIEPSNKEAYYELNKIVGLINYGNKENKQDD